MNAIELKQHKLSASKHCFIQTNGKLVDNLTKKYGRQIALKIFDGVSVESENDFYTVKWGDDPTPGNPRKNTKLWEATQIQNIAVMHNLAPRVYGLETVFLAEKLRPVQVTELLPTEYDEYQNALNVYEEVIGLGKKYNFEVAKADVSDRDVMCNKLVDFQTFAFTKDYKDKVREIYCEEGKYGKVYYQDIPELEFSGGPRKSDLRIKELGLDKIDFQGKTVWDIGCAGGFFTRYAYSRGAKSVIGFDMEKPITAAKHVANYLGFFNLDYEVIDLSNPDVLMDRQKPDICFFLSMNFHIGIPKFLQDCQTVIFEDNDKNTRHNITLDRPWNVWFKDIKYLGQNTDHGQKSIHHLSK